MLFRSPDFIIPAKAVQELQRLLGEEGDAIAKLSDNQIVFEVGSSVIVSKLIEGNYPNYRQVIPGEAKETLNLGREATPATARRATESEGRSGGEGEQSVWGG